MTFEKDSTFARVIEEHLDLKRRNTELEPAMPIDRYRVGDPFENHPLFKTEEQARLEDTLDGVESPVEEATVLAWPVQEVEEPEADEAAEPEESLWGRSRDFDWGD
jgi:hypothetical protein